MANYYEKAHALVTSPEARKAFDISAEPAAVREAYGQTSLGQCASMMYRSPAQVSASTQNVTAAFG